ncbi:MAG: hypothetical protein JNL05_06385 [Flavobacteriales bacterium]|nr:hypothetical protein [Flavobacteriales bacterium]
MLRQRHLLVLLFTALASSVMAQDDERLPTPRMFEKGRFYVSAAASWKVQDYDLKDISQWNLEPMVGYFVRDRLAVGFGGVVGIHDFTYLQENTAIGTSTYKDEETKWGALGPTVRGYLGGPKIAAFGQFGAFFGNIEQNAVNNETANGQPVKQVKDGSFQAYDFGAGLAVYYKQVIGLELMAHYYLLYAQTTTTTTFSDGSQTVYPRTKNNGDGGGASLGIVFHFGLQKGRGKQSN